MSSRPANTKRHGYHGWIPRHPEFYKHYTRGCLKDISRRNKTMSDLSDTVQAFKDAIESDPEMVDLFTQVFLQAPEENEVCHLVYIASLPALTITLGP